MTDWTGGPDPELSRELAGEFEDPIPEPEPVP